MQGNSLEMTLLGHGEMSLQLNLILQRNFLSQQNLPELSLTASDRLSLLAIIPANAVNGPNNRDAV